MKLSHKIFDETIIGDDTIIAETGKVYNKRIKKEAAEEKKGKAEEGEKISKGRGERGEGRDCFFLDRQEREG